MAYQERRSSDDFVPSGWASLREAIDAFAAFWFPEWAGLVLSDEEKLLLQSVRNIRLRSISEPLRADQVAILERENRLVGFRRQAWERLRSQLHLGEIVAAVCDRTTGELIQVPPAKWATGMGRFEMLSSVRFAIGHNLWTHEVSGVPLLAESVLPVSQTIAVPKRRFDEMAARYIIEAEMEKLGGFIAKDVGAKILIEEHNFDIDRDAARDFVGGITGNSKPGPKGPRKKPKNSAS